MSAQEMTLHLPEDLYEQLRQKAESSKQAFADAVA